MASTTYDRSRQSIGPTPQKRYSTHLGLPSPSKRRKNDSTLDISGSAHPSISSGTPRGGRTGAERWFDDANRNAPTAAPFLDKDPPFYVDRRPSSDGNSVSMLRSGGSPLKGNILGKPTAPTKSLLAQMESSESNSEDYRSVIDDLTVQNKKLKKKLRQYEKLHCSHLQEDKLFEVRIHGLAPHRKRELENTLRSFASSSEGSCPDNAVSESYAAMSRAPRLRVGHSVRTTDKSASIRSEESMTPLRKPSPASTACSKPIDSAYASMSGATGNSQAKSQGKGLADRLAQNSRTQQNVKSFLHDIPETLVPKHAVAMSERSRKQLVVKRLEQIFTGKGAASRHPTQAHQQQEFAPTATILDQPRLGADGNGFRTAREGMREARILPDDFDLQADSLSESNIAVPQSRQSSRDRRESIRGVPASRDQSPDQRPTRPLDLDLHRVQVPAENIDYIRHLGLSSPSAPENPAPEDGWVYLNLLISMAQLHTLNVTPAFIRQAITDTSSKLQLSLDGTKVRWRGGTEGSSFSSDNDETSDIDMLGTHASSTFMKTVPSEKSANEAVSHDNDSTSAALPLLHPESSANQVPGPKRRPISLNQAHNGANLDYKPLFFHDASSQDSDEPDSASDSAASSDFIENATGMVSGINSGSHGLRESEVKLRTQNAENGPIIFYHKARFCTDLSGDPDGAPYDQSAYYQYTQDPIGSVPIQNDKLENDTTKGLLDSLGSDHDSVHTTDSALDLDDLKSCFSDCFSSAVSNPLPLPMEASGLGGIQPDDNFMVKVKVQHHDRGKDSSLRASIPSCHLPNWASRKVAKAPLTSGYVPRSQPIELPVTREIISTDRTILKPSSLPSPSYACLPFSSSGSEDEDDEEQSSIMPYYKTRSPRKTPEDNSTDSSSDKMKADLAASAPSSFCDDDDADDDDDDSIDLLAHARVLDPETVAAHEREFENNINFHGDLATTSHTQLPNVVQSVDSDVNSMSVDEDGRSRMDCE